MNINLSVYELNKNLVNTQKQQVENAISESIFCIYACLDILSGATGFVLEFSPVIQYA